MHAQVELDGSAPVGYRLLGLVGFGPTGQVWRAREDASGAVVALRLLRRPAGSGGAVAARLRELSGRLERLGHPHVLRLRRVLPGQRDGQVWCVADLAPGGSLAALLARRSVLSPGEVVAIGVPVAEALQALHARGMAHGALHAGNILLDAQGRPLLADAGLAEALRPAVVGGPLLDPSGLAERSGESGWQQAEAATLARLLEGCLGLAGMADRSAATRSESEPVLAALQAAQREAGSAGRLAETLRAAADPAPVRLLAGTATPARPQLSRGRQSSGPASGPRPTRRRSHRRSGPSRSRPSRRAMLLVAAAAALLLSGGLRLAATTWAEESAGAAGRATAEPAIAMESHAAATTGNAATTDSATPAGTAPTTSVGRGLPDVAALAGDDPVVALRTLDAARSAALAELDAVLLGSLYLPGVPARVADLALLRDLAATGERPDGYRLEVLDAEVLHQDGASATVRVTDLVPPFAVRGEDGTLLRMDPGRGERVFEVDLARRDGRWCYAASRAVEVG